MKQIAIVITFVTSIKGALTKKTLSPKIYSIILS